MCVCAFSWCVVSENQDSSLRECVCVCAFCGVWQSKGMCACVPLWRVVSENKKKQSKGRCACAVVVRGT